MHTKHGVLYGSAILTLNDSGWNNQELAGPTRELVDLAELALEQRISHLWVMPEVGTHNIPASHGAYSIQPYERHHKTATISVWKRGTGHVDIIYPHHTAWSEVAEVTPKELLGAISYQEQALGVTITGSPGSVGWNLLKKIHPEWIEDIPVNLRDLHFTKNAGDDIRWQREITLDELQGFLVKFDKHTAYPYAGTQTDIGVGTPEHLEGDEANRASIHEKGHPQEVGVWRCSIKYDGSLYHPDMPPVWKEDKGSYAGSEGWLSGPIIRMLRAFGHEVTVHEGWVFPERHDLLVKWGNLLWNVRQNFDDTERFRNRRYAEIAKRWTKRIANSTIGFTAFKGFEDDEEEKRRPDIRLQVVSRNRELMRHNIEKIRELYGKTPLLVYMDAVYYLCDNPAGYPVREGFSKREALPGGFKYEGAIELTDEVHTFQVSREPDKFLTESTRSLLSTKHTVVDKLAFLNKKGWVK